MSLLGFTANERKATGKRTLNASTLYRGPPNPRLQKFYEEAERKRKEALAVQDMSNGGGAPQPQQVAQPARPTAVTRQMQQPAAARAPSIEQRIQDAHDLIDKLQHSITGTHTQLEEKVTEAHQHVVSTHAILTELREEMGSLRTAAQDAWLASHIMYGDVAERGGVFTAPPPNGDLMNFLEGGTIIQLVGQMHDTPLGPAMQMRQVDDNGQFIMGWVLLQDDQGNRLVNNLRVVP